MKNKKLIIVTLISLGLGYYFGMKKGKSDANATFMKLVASQDIKRGQLRNA
jgi:hypothetical protein